MSLTATATIPQVNTCQMGSLGSSLPIAGKPATKNSSIAQTIWDVVKNIFKAAIGVALYWTSPALFTVGFVVGIIADEKITKGIQKIDTVWKAQKTPMRVLIGTACAFSVPVVGVVAAFLFAADIGANISHRAHELMHQKLTH